MFSSPLLTSNFQFNNFGNPKSHDISINRNFAKNSEPLKTDRKVLRGCILYEFNQGSTVTNAYERFCTAVGADVIGFREFDFWFHGLGNKSLSLNSEIEFDSKTSPLSKMPVEIFKEVLNHGDITDRMVLRKVSRHLRTIIDNANSNFESIRLDICPSFAVLDIDEDHSVKYQNNNGDSMLEAGEFVKTKKEVDYFELALHDMTGHLKNVKSHLNSLRLGVPQEISPFGPSCCLNKEERKICIEKIENKLKTENTKFNVKKFVIRGFSFHQVATLLPYFKEKVLEEIHLEMYNTEMEEESTEVLFNLDQWKNAKILEIKWNVNLPIPVEHYSHFSRFHISTTDFTINDAIKIRDELIKRDTFISGYVKAPIQNPKEIAQIFKPNNEDGFGTFMYTNDSSEFLIDFDFNHFEIGKKR
ncbi:F-box domain-containing protein [Caenorhabditis elegans]|uniref:F-box domain-containing protein n=1 Tax=Caenorhabditis elegans TaxID=6239 RepID=Q9N2T3_CAEEL|nr:F-box domain-containing protein [Caenorhabditis elegans]CCD68692.3 F-box domain-containing protein [Caenorhabditis elegans]|eukprot:NP_500676.3 Uncharacterized protein CELE_Y9C9A.8 [Caenorhabditis elegans]